MQFNVWLFLFLFACLSRKLKRLNLGGNELTAVPQKALSLLENLRKLEIQENKIRDIKEGDFEGESLNCCWSLTTTFSNRCSLFAHSLLAERIAELGLINSGAQQTDKGAGERV